MPSSFDCYNWCHCQIQLCPPCNTVRSGHFCILCNRVRDYAKTVRRKCTCVHNCTCKCARKRACMHWTYVHAAGIFTYFIIAANTQRQVIHDLVKMANVFRLPRAFNLLQGRFCTGADTTAYAIVSGRTQLHYAAASGRTRLHMQNRPADINAYAIMSSR